MIDIPADMDSVVKRWYPDGVDVVEAGRVASPKGLFVTGTNGAGASTVEAELDFMAGAALERASDIADAAVVLFVLDASAPLGRRALADLAPALESATVGLVVNKIDVHRDWRDVQRMVAEAVAEHVPRSVDVSFWPTSAKLAERARVAVDPKMRAALVEESGIPEVLRFVVDALVQPERILRERKYAAAVHTAAAGARREIVKKARAVTSTSTTVGLRAERARLAEIRDRSRAERATELRGRLQLARSEVVHDINEEFRRFAGAAKKFVDEAAKAELLHACDHIGDRLDQAAVRVDGRLTDRLRAIDSDLNLSAEIPAKCGAVLDLDAPTERKRGVEDKMMIVLGASAGVGLGRLAVSPLAMVPGLDIAVLPISLLLGALTAWWLVRSRRLVADRAHIRSWVADAAVAAKSVVEQAALARLLAAETAFSSAAKDGSRLLAVAAESDLEQVEDRLRAAAEHRAAVLAACDRDLVSLDRGLEKFVLPFGLEPHAPSLRLNG